MPRTRTNRQDLPALAELVETITDWAARDRLAKEAVSAQRVASFCTARVLGADLDAPRPYSKGC
ncbi:hypothetical protein ACFLIM_14380 [Nonomuraea sp. M3C6]|uniref:Uncharacterized protein n=1 Tax=Nonomuraea marmarensis TaxID=3351344 RepID=A0ABW7AAK7_9ACTN